MPDLRILSEERVAIKRVALPAGNRQQLLRRLYFAEYGPADFWWKAEPPAPRQKPPPLVTSALARNTLILSAGVIEPPPEPPAPTVRSIVRTEIYRVQRVATRVEKPGEL
jgi:hypothetical protein